MQFVPNGNEYIDVSIGVKFEPQRDAQRFLKLFLCEFCGSNNINLILVDR